MLPKEWMWTNERTHKMKRYKIHLIVGARPNFMKMAPLQKEFLKHTDIFDVKLVHTGQHYDNMMSDIFFEQLNMPAPDIYLNVGSGSHAQQTARIMQKYEEYVLQNTPDHTIVCGDVNSTIACAIVATKMNIKVSHIEAGLRSYDKSMPEEINRVATDAIADLLFVHSEQAKEILINEGRDKKDIYMTGNIMIDSLVQNEKIAQKSNILNTLNLIQGESITDYALVTLHRPVNVDTQKGLKTLIETFEEISKKIKLICPIHPRTIKNIETFDLQDKIKNIKNMTIIEPVGYHDCIKLQMNARLVITDSGGLQEETTYFGIPCLTMRDTTEWLETLTIGTNQLVRQDKTDILTKVEKILTQKNTKRKNIPLWDGNTAKRIVEVFISLSL